MTKLIISVVFILTICAAVFTVRASRSIKLPSADNFLSDIEINDIYGEPFRFSKYEGDVILLVNVASRCGFTKQYAGLEKIYDEYKDQGFVVIGVPSNDFANQEPGSEKEILDFCKRTYDVTFPMLAKTKVKGKEKHELYAKLTSKKHNPGYYGAIKWNFNKFLIDRKGRVVYRFSSLDKPDSEKVRKVIESFLKSKRFPKSQDE